MGSSCLTEPLLGPETAQSVVNFPTGATPNPFEPSCREDSEPGINASHSSLRRSQLTTREASMTPYDEVSQSKNGSSVLNASTSASSQDVLQPPRISPTIQEADYQPWR